MHKKVIILILSYNGKHLLDESVSTYLENDYPNFEVVVIDNGSTDETKAWTEQNFPKVEVLRTEKNLGYSGGFNFGLDYSFNEKQADYVLITNNDVKADTKVVSELVKVMESDESIGFVTGKVYFYDHPNILQTVGYYTDPVKWIGGHLGGHQEDKGQFDKVEERPYSDDIFALVSKNCYQATQGYDTEFQFQAEQFDWQIRAKKKGFKIYYTPHAKIWHKDSITIGKSSPFKMYYDVRNTFIVRLKHREDSYLKNYTKYYLRDIVILPLLKNMLKLKLNYVYKIITAFLSATKWGIYNRKLKLEYFI